MCREGNGKLLAIAFTFIFLIGLSAIPCWASNVHGVLKVVKGNVGIKSGKTGKTLKGKVGSKVYPTDTVITGKDSRAKIIMVDNNEINVSPNTQIKIENYEFEPAKNKKNVLLNVIYGKVRSKVNQKYNGDTAKFQVKTKSAVAGVRGTDFLTSFNQKSNKTNIVTFEGQVKFGLPGPNGSIQNAVSVKVGELASSIAGNAPKPPVKINPASLVKLDQGSAVETGPTAPVGPGDPRAPANNDNDLNDEDGGDKKDGGKREPGSVGPGPEGPAPNGACLMCGDPDIKESGDSFFGDPSRDSLGVAALPPPPPPDAVLNQPAPDIKCSTCTDRIQGENTLIKVIVNTGN